MNCPLAAAHKKGTSMILLSFVEVQKQLTNGDGVIKGHHHLRGGIVDVRLNGKGD